MSLRTKAIWNGYSNASAGLIKGQEYEIEYEAVFGAIKVTYQHEGQSIDMLYKTIKAYAANWKVRKPSSRT